MPIERSSPGRITFSWKSKASIYAFIFYTILTVNILFVGHERMKVLQNTKKFDEYIYGILFLIFLIPHFWIPFVGWVKSIFELFNNFLIIHQFRALQMTSQVTKLRGGHFKFVIIE
jgi:gustatory receptor